MKLSDRTSGLALAVLGAVALQAALRLPPMAGQPIGPSAFPAVVGAGLIVCGLLVAAGVGRRFEGPPDEPSAVRPTLRSRAAVLVPPALLVAYVLAANTVGFVLMAAAMLLITARLLGSRWRSAVGLALAVPPLLHLVFAKGLRVPLPVGWLPMPW